MPPDDDARRSGAAHRGRPDGKLDLLVIQPTPFCNIACSYCYLTDKDSRERMTDEVLVKTFERVFAHECSSEGFTVVWHAGEPLTMPIAFYEKAFALVERANHAKVGVVHSVQTNAMPITQRWCDFIKASDFRVGVSLDGPADLHDLHRITRTGEGTHAKVMQGVELLQKNGIPFHVIAVLTNESLRQPERMFEFFLESGIDRVGFNIEEIEGANHSGGIAGDDPTSIVKSFMKRFLDLANAASRKIVVREFENLAPFILRRTHAEHTNQECAPFRILNVDYAGNISTFSPELLGMDAGVYGSFNFGNVSDTSLAEIERSPHYLQVRDAIVRGVEACRSSCDYYEMCGGGSPSNKFFESGRFDTTETQHCRLTKKAVVDVMVEHFEAQLGLT